MYEAKTLHVLKQQFLSTSAPLLSKVLSDPFFGESSGKGVIPTTVISLSVINMSGTTPNLDIYIDYSTDGLFWTNCATLNATTWGQSTYELYQSKWPILRLRAQLTGTAAKVLFDAWVSFSEQ